MMLGITLLCLSLTGVHAVPLGLRVAHVAGPAGGPRPGVEPAPRWSPRDFRQGTEPLGRVPADPDTGLVQERHSEMDRRADPVAEMERHWSHEVEVPVQRSGAGWVRVEEHSEDKVPEGFRQGTEPMMSIPEGFRQGTEPIMPIPEGFRQGTEPIMPIPEGFRQGTEPIMPIPEGFRQGTEPIMPIPEGFRQGTEPVMPIPEGFRQGTEPIMPIPKGFRQGTEPSTFVEACKGKVINGRCNQFNPKPLSFQDAQSGFHGDQGRHGQPGVDLAGRRGQGPAGAVGGRLHVGLQRPDEGSPRLRLRQARLPGDVLHRRELVVDGGL